MIKPNVNTAKHTTAAVPNAYVFRIKPDGTAYMTQALENTDILPDISRDE